MTHNQIDYWKMRNDKFINEQKNAETKRYNLVQEELKRIDQDLQRDLMAINARYKQKELDLAEEELKWKQRYQQTQLRLEQSRVDITRHQTAINAMAVSETKRSNLVNETIAQAKLDIDQALAPYNRSKVWSDIQVNSARKGLIEQQTITEQEKPFNIKTQNFQNIVNPFVNLAGGILRAAF